MNADSPNIWRLFNRATIEKNVFYYLHVSVNIIYPDLLMQLFLINEARNVLDLTRFCQLMHELEAKS